MVGREWGRAIEGEHNDFAGARFSLSFLRVRMCVCVCVGGEREREGGGETGKKSETK